jgi:putative membrane protein
MQNQDLRATDVLANERTFLAYVRTSIAFIGFGFVIARFALFTREVAIIAHISDGHAGVVSSALGSLMAVFGVLVGLLGGYRYAKTDRGLHEGRVFSLSPSLAYIGTVLLAAIGLLVAFGISMAW